MPWSIAHTIFPAAAALTMLGGALSFWLAFGFALDRRGVPRARTAWSLTWHGAESSLAIAIVLGWFWPAVSAPYGDSGVTLTQTTTMLSLFAMRYMIGRTFKSGDHNAILRQLFIGSLLVVSLGLMQGVAMAFPDAGVLLAAVPMLGASLARWVFWPQARARFLAT